MAVGDAHVFPGFLIPVLTQLSFQSHRLLFSHALKVRGENTPERKFASTGYPTHNHRITSQTHSSLSHPGRAKTKQITVILVLEKGLIFLHIGIIELRILTTNTWNGPGSPPRKPLNSHQATS